MRTTFVNAYATLVITVLFAACSGLAFGAEAIHEAELIFPLQNRHNHASCIVECPNGDLLACWYRGVGPEKGDDVAVLGARRRSGSDQWSEPFVMADTPGYPDDNPCMFVDPQGRLWLFWPTLLANEWGTALMKYRISSDYQMPEGPPVWDWQDVLHVTPDDFEAQIAAGLERYAKQNPRLMERFPQAEAYAERIRERAAGKLTQRVGWMTRVHPTLLPGPTSDAQARPPAGAQARPTAGGQASGRLIVPLYTDAFSISIMAITDDWGKTWLTSEALVGFGNIQPSVVRKNDGTLVAMMRENGPQNRIRISESSDDGLTWTPVGNMDLPNPGSGVEVIRLANGHWALVYNDTEEGRHSLAVSISDDEGKTWKWTRHLDLSERGQGSYSYPSIVQARDGTLHATYSYHVGDRGESIKHAAFDEEWVMRGDAD
ncbi:MAG: exo-alpha-sialidase [Armatimonadota bacterium]|nr:MAG: exo-alpha-sialidase [Armatimonadota bacterium]